MEKNTYTKVWEHCPHCDTDVELNAELSVQTCPVCGRRIVTCSMCRACDTEDDYCTHCCLDYQARVENQEADWRYKGHLISFEPSKSKDGIMATAIRIADGKAMFCVYGTDERDARIEAENTIDTREMLEDDEPETVQDIMDTTGGHDPHLVEQINEKWGKFKDNFKPVLTALYERDSQEIFNCEAFGWGDGFQEVKGYLEQYWDLHARTYLKHVADDQDLELIIKFVRFDVCEDAQHERIFFHK